MFELKSNIDDIVKRCVSILVREKIQISDDEKKKITNFVSSRFPDIRKTINDLQKFSISGNLVISQNDEVLDFANFVYKKIIEKESSLKIRKYIIESENLFNSNYQSLLKSLFEMFYESDLSEKIKKMILLDIGEYMYKDNFVIDHEINFYCCVYSIENTLKD